MRVAILLISANIQTAITQRARGLVRPLESDIIEAVFQTYSVFGWMCETSIPNILKLSWRRIPNVDNLKAP